MSGRWPRTRSAAAAKIAPSRQCSVRSRSTRRGDQAVVARWYGSESMKRWMPYGSLSARIVRTSARENPSTSAIVGHGLPGHQPPCGLAKRSDQYEDGRCLAAAAELRGGATRFERDRVRRPPGPLGDELAVARAESRYDEGDEMRIEPEIRERHARVLVRPHAAEPQDRVEHPVVVGRPPVPPAALRSHGCALCRARTAPTRDTRSRDAHLRR